MITALLILLALLVLAAIAYTFYGIVTGCPFALFTLASGGVETLFTLLGEILKNIGE